ncbi:MAG: hypothetical protein QW472_02660 [Candidatus Aenigmatarchaeota archaeon]
MKSKENNRFFYIPINFQERRIQYGVVENIDTSKVGIQSGNVVFESPFTKIPIVMLTLENLDGEYSLKLFGFPTEAIADLLGICLFLFQKLEQLVISYGWR